jgi:hypothetical protein
MNIYNALNLKKGVQLFDNNERYFFYSWNYGIKDIPRMKVTLNIRNYPKEQLIYQSNKWKIFVLI